MKIIKVGTQILDLSDYSVIRVGGSETAPEVNFYLHAGSANGRGDYQLTGEDAVRTAAYLFSPANTDVVDIDKFWNNREAYKVLQDAQDVGFHRHVQGVFNELQSLAAAQEASGPASAPAPPPPPPPFNPPLPAPPAVGGSRPRDGVIQFPGGLPPDMEPIPGVAVTPSFTANLTARQEGE
jgi:hypothetical protein